MIFLCEAANSLGVEEGSAPGAALRAPSLARCLLRLLLVLLAGAPRS